MHPLKNNISNYIYAFIVVVFFVGLYFSVINQSDNYSAINPIDDSISKDWLARDGSHVELSDIKGLKQGEVLSHSIPHTIKNGDAINFDSHNVRFSMKINGREVYRYYPDGNLTGMGNGDTYHSIPLIEEYADGVIELTIEPIYTNDSSSSFKYVMIGHQDAYYRYVLKEYSPSFFLSVMIIFFGAALVIIRYGLADVGDKANIRAIGVSIFVIGIWAAIETTVPTLIFGHSEIWRALDYFAILLVEFPFIRFVNSVTLKKKKIYENISLAIVFVTFLSVTILRTVFEVDLHNVPIIYLSYFLQIILIAVILSDNHIYVKEKGREQNLYYLYIGLSCFVAGVFVNMIVYHVLNKEVMDYGFFARLGISVFVVLIYMQILSNLDIEHRNQRSSNFINKLLQYSLAASSSDKIIKQMLEFIGTETGAKRVYIFEEKDNGFFSNSYEWTADGVLPEKNILKKVPFVGLLDTWFEDFGKFGFVYIDDLEEYKEKSEPMYEFAKLLDIKRHISGPLIIDGEYIGFFGIDDPSETVFSDVSYSIKLIAYFMAVMLRQRNNQVLLRKYSYRDQMTGVMNRRALEEFVENEIDPEIGTGVLMCDINGLKRANDQLGHEAGDTMIRDVADCLSEVFTQKQVYRMGGDEFLVVSVASSKVAFEQRVRTVRLLIEARGRSASMGYAYGYLTRDSFDEMQKQADKLMYEDKRAYYEVHPDRRRRE